MMRPFYLKKMLGITSNCNLRLEWLYAKMIKIKMFGAFVTFLKDSVSTPQLFSSQRRHIWHIRAQLEWLAKIMSPWHNSSKLVASCSMASINSSLLPVTQNKTFAMDIAGQICLISHHLLWCDLTCPTVPPSSLNKAYAFRTRWKRSCAPRTRETEPIYHICWDFVEDLQVPNPLNKSGIYIYI